MEELPTAEYLIYDGTSPDVVTVVMPEPPTDEDMSGFTDINRECGTYPTDFGNFRNGPRRIQRTAAGNLLLRPRSQVVGEANGRFGLLYKGHGRPRCERRSFDQISRFQARLGIFRERHESWEVDVAYHESDYLERAGGDEEYWRTTSIGIISYIDRYDLPIDEHVARARAIIGAGSEFAIVCKVDAAEAMVFRMSGVESFPEDFRLPEWPWFEVPLRIAVE